MASGPGGIKVISTRDIKTALMTPSMRSNRHSRAVSISTLQKNKNLF